MMRKNYFLFILFIGFFAPYAMAQNNSNKPMHPQNSPLLKMATPDDYKKIVKLKSGVQPSISNKVAIQKTGSNSTSFINKVTSNTLLMPPPTPPECDTLLTQWETPTPTVTTYGFGGGWISGIPDPANSVLPTDPKGVYEGYTSPNPGTAVVGGVRVGLGTLHDLDSNTTFQVVVYDDDGSGAPGAFLGGLAGLNPTTLGVPGSGLYTDYWIPFTTTLIPTTAFFHVGVEIFPGDGTDSLIVMTSCLGPTNCAVAQGENDASNHIFTTGFGFENLLTVYGADFDVDIIPTFGEYAIFNYSAASYCTTASNETPTFLGATGGTFSASPTGLSINPGTGEITFSTSTPNTYTVTYTAPGTCAKTTTATVTVNGPATVTTNTNICYNSSYTYADATVSNNITSNESHVSTFTGMAANGCDSILTENLIVIPLKTGTVNNTICNNGSVTVNGTVYNAGNPTGTEIFTNIGPNNCDSTVTVSLNVLPALTGTVNNTICNNGSVTVNGTVYNAGNPTGTEIFTNVGPNNCDSTVTVSLNVLPALTGTVNNTICNNGSVTVNGTVYNAGNPTGTEIFTNIGPNNCDSTVTVSLNVLPALTGTVNNTICNNGSVTVNGTVYNAGNPTGTEIFTNVGPNNCDSTVTVSLNVLPALTGTVNNTICNNDSVVVNGTTYNAGNPTGTEIFTNVGPNNCDSTVTVNLNVLAAIDITVNNTSPTLTSNENGASYQWLDCDNNFAVIPTATSQSYTATANGNYAVEITVGSCVDTSACENVSSVGINENSFGANFKIYPNPTKDVINIDLGNTNENMQISILSVDGKLVYQLNNITDRIVPINLATFSKGVYILKVSDATQQSIHRITKK